MIQKRGKYRDNLFGVPVDGSTIGSQGAPQWQARFRWLIANAPLYRLGTSIDIYLDVELHRLWRHYTSYSTDSGTAHNRIPSRGLTDISENADRSG